jgi:hypothetical protein
MLSPHLYTPCLYVRAAGAENSTYVHRDRRLIRLTVQFFECALRASNIKDLQSALQRSTKKGRNKDERRECCGWARLCANTVLYRKISWCTPRIIGSNSIQWRAQLKRCRFNGMNVIDSKNHFSRRPFRQDRKRVTSDCVRAFAFASQMLTAYIDVPFSLTHSLSVLYCNPFMPAVWR